MVNEGLGEFGIRNSEFGIGKKWMRSFEESASGEASYDGVL